MDELRFDDRVAVVTGAGRGLGRSYARLLASRGALVVVNDTGGSLPGEGTDPEPANQVEEEIKAGGGIAVADTSDVATVEGGEAVVARALAEFGRVDIVVTNAGILRDKAFHNMTPEMFDAVVAVHLRGAFCVTRPAFPHMRAQGYGRIVTVTSASGLYGNFGQANYSAAKMGLVGLARTLALEGARYDVKANVVSPTALTRMTEGLMGDLGPQLPPDLVAPVVAWLCHEDCPVTGEVMAAGGGHVARTFVAETEGYTNPHLTLEDVAAHATQILDTSRYTTPTDVSGATKLILAGLASATSAVGAPSTEQ